MQKLRGFILHGFEPKGSSGDQTYGVCPICSKQKMYINPESKKWDCKSGECSTGGGYGLFLQRVSDKNIKNFKSKPQLELLKDRGLKHSKTFKAWGVGWNGSAYTIPVKGQYNLQDLRVFRPGFKTMSSPGGKAGLISPSGQDLDKFKEVWLVEGEWDGMSLYEIFQENDYKAAVLVTPGANIFKAEWIELFRRKNVVIAYDNDGAGELGELRAYESIRDSASSVKFVHWDKLGLTETGYDLRDLYTDSGDPETALKALMSLLEGKPRQKPEKEPGKSQSKDEGESGQGLTREEVISSYTDWLHLPNTDVIDILYGTVLANRLPGDPLWMFLIAPPGGSKSELLMSLSDAPKIFTTTSLTPHALVSGANLTGGRDPSLIPKLNNKVLVIKDFTTILSMNYTAREEILGVLRDAYDGKTEKVFGTGVLREYKSKFGLIGGVTPALGMYNALHGTLGERFIHYRLEKQRGSDETDLITRALDNIAKEGEMRDGLCKTAAQALDRSVEPGNMPDMSREFKLRLVDLAKLTAVLRAVVVKEKYTGEMLFLPTPEVGTRLAKQFGKLAYGIGIFHGVDEVGEDIYRLIVRVAKDTIPDRVEKLVRVMHLKSKEGEFVDAQRMSDLTRMNVETTRALMQDLTTLKVLEKAKHNRMSSRYRIAPKFRSIIERLEIFKEKRKPVAKKKKKK